MIGSFRRTTRAGFTLIELLVVIAIIALLIGILLPAMSEARKTAKTTKCIAKMQQIGVAVNSYAISYQDKIVSFSWTRNLPVQTAFADLAPPATGYADDLQAAASQAIDIIRRRIPVGAGDIQRPANWIPQILYNHLALVEDQDWTVPTQNMLCTEDAARNRWTKSWSTFVSGAAAPYAGGGATPAADQRRWFASASFNFVPAAMAPDSGSSAIINAGTHRFYSPIANPNVVGKRKYSSVLNPTGKVVVYDNEARHFGKRSWHCVYPEAKQPLLFFDGHVNVHTNGVPSLTGNTLPFGQQRKGNEVNPGWIPTAPTGGTPFTYGYQNPEPWEAPLRNGTYTGTDTMTGYYRYTRGGLKGHDVGAAEPHFPN